MTSPAPARRLRAACLIASSALALAACATVPDLGPAPQPKAPPASPVSIPASAAAWPAEDWWRAYGDPQLTSLIEEALSGAPDLAQAQARVRKAEALARQAGAARSPQLGLSGQVAEVRQSENLGLPPALVPGGWQDHGEVAFDLSYELDFWGKNRATLAAATSETEAARAEAAAVRLAVSTGVAAAYAEFLRLHADRDAAQAAVDIRARTHALMTERAAAGLETEAATRRALSSLAAARAELAAADEALELARNLLAALVGQGPDRGRAIGRPAQPRIVAFGAPADAEVSLIGRRPDLAAQRLRAEAAAARIDAARADFYPNVRLSALFGVQAVGLDLLAKSSSGFASVGPAFSLPIFTGGRISGAYRGARADYDAAVAAYDAALVIALQETADALASQRALEARLSGARAATAAAQDAWRLVQDRYRGGLATYLDVLTAEDSLVAQRRIQAGLETRAFTLDVALVRALGGGFQSAS